MKQEHSDNDRAIAGALRANCAAMGFALFRVARDDKL